MSDIGWYTWGQESLIAEINLIWEYVQYDIDLSGKTLNELTRIKNEMLEDLPADDRKRVEQAISEHWSNEYDRTLIGAIYD